MNILDDNDSEVDDGIPVRLGMDPKIDWFHFETRMRNLIQEMLDPVVRRNAEDSASLKLIEHQYEKLIERQDDSEYKIQRLEDLKSDISMLDNKINELKGTRRVDDEKILMEIANFKSHVEQIKHQSDHANNIARNIEMHLEKLNVDISNVNDEFFKLKENVHNKVLQVSKEVTTALATFKDLNSETETKLSSVISEFGNIKDNLDKFHSGINSCKEENEKLAAKMAQLQGTTASGENLQNFINNCNEVFHNYDEDLAAVNHKIYLLEEYCDKYVPMKIQSTISGTVAPILSSKKKKLIKSVVSDKLDEIKQNIASEKEANIEKKLNMIAKASGRKQYESIKKVPRTPLNLQGSVSSMGFQPPKLSNINDSEHKKMSYTTGMFNKGGEELLGNKNPEDSESQWHDSSPNKEADSPLVRKSVSKSNFRTKLDPNQVRKEPQPISMPNSPGNFDRNTCIIIKNNH